MKTIFKTLAVAAYVAAAMFLAASCKNSTGSAPSADIPDHYTVPRELVYAQEETYQAGEQSYPLYIIDKFYPIGWSQDGKLAYMEEPADEAVGAYFFQFHILDLNTGQDVFSWKPAEDPETGSLNQMFEDNKELFEGKLKEHGIIPQEFKLEGNNLPFMGNNAKVWMDKTQQASEFLGVDIVTSVKLSCGTAEKSTVIYEKENKDQYNSNLDQDIAGTLKCPYKDMAAVMVKSIHRGYEGPPHVYSFYFAKAEKQ